EATAGVEEGMLALAALLVALAVPAPLPDLDQAPPQGLSVVQRHGRLLLVFGSAVDNVGPGELVVEAKRVRGAMKTRQVVAGRCPPCAPRRTSTGPSPASNATSCAAPPTSRSSAATGRRGSACATPTRRAR